MGGVALCRNAASLACFLPSFKHIHDIADFPKPLGHIGGHGWRGPQCLAQRRRQIVSDSHQLRLDVDHFNDVHADEPQLELVLDFTDDVKEMMIAEGLEDVA